MNYTKKLERILKKSDLLADINPDVLSNDNPDTEVSSEKIQLSPENLRSFLQMIDSCS